MPSIWSPLLSFIMQDDDRAQQLDAELDELDQALVVYTWLRRSGITTPEPQRTQLAPQASRALRRWAQHMTQSAAAPPVARWLDVEDMPDFLETKLHQYVRRELRAGGKVLLPPVPLPFDMYAEGL